MDFYFYAVAAHVVAAVFWLGMIPAHLVLRNVLFEPSAGRLNKGAASAWLKILNITGMAGMTGVLLTGIIMVVLGPGYGFFQFSQNHWLGTKQVILVVIVVITAVRIIPLGKQIRLAIADSNAEAKAANGKLANSVKSLSESASLVAILVSVDFLLGLLHSVVHLY